MYDLGSKLTARALEEVEGEDIILVLSSKREKVYLSFIVLIICLLVGSDAILVNIYGEDIPNPWHPFHWYAHTLP